APVRKEPAPVAPPVSAPPAAPGPSVASPTPETEGGRPSPPAPASPTDWSLGGGMMQQSDQEEPPSPAPAPPEEPPPAPAGPPPEEIARARDQEAQAAWASGDGDRALACWDEVLQLDPEHAGAHAGRGEVYLNRRDYDQAL